MRTKSTFIQNQRHALILANAVKCLLTVREITAVCSLLCWMALSSSLEECCNVLLGKILKFLGNRRVPGCVSPTGVPH